jgi:hypothetical protein|tara:strand:- start:165 stop:425 length:261 start_codon:yes stop_codon:yes gene_type:complete
MATQKHMGRYDLIERLSAQVGNRDTAIEILKNRGHLTKDGKFTVEGMKRNAMTAEERAKDRISKKTGKPTSAFKYNPKTNMAKLKG